ncbi:MAG: BMP family ABC transporter substrate-binding protein [Spirochaetales bacterium]|jgi:basic membrane protein A
MKNVFKVIALVLLFALVAGNLWAADPKKMVMAMVTNQSGLGDQSFNDAAWEGLAQAVAKYGIERKVLESREQAQYVPNLSTLAEQKASLIIGVGFMIKDAVAEAAKMFPNSNFVLIDGATNLPNVADISFKENEGAFLVGVIAAKVSKTGTIGFVGGVSTPVTNRMETGYKAGALTVNPKIKVLTSYAGSFADPAKGEEMAIPQYDQGADVVFQVAGQTGLGVINAAKKKGKFVIGIDRDQNYLAPANVLTSLVKRVDTAVLNACGMVINGNFKGGAYFYGLKEGAVDFATTGNLIPPDVIAFANMVRGKVISGEIKAPATYDELAAFKPPKL